MKRLLNMLVCALLVLSIKTQAQNRELSWGLIGKSEFNRFRIGDATATKIIKQPGFSGALGVYGSMMTSRHWVWDASVLLTRATYSVNYKSDNAEFIDADIRFTEANINLNYIVNPNNVKANFFVFGGGQLLYRRWGEERFIQQVIDHSYWPASRVMLQCGIGARLKIAEHCVRGPYFYLQPFVGVRYLPSQQLVYDTPFNQFFAGIIICKGRSMKSAGVKGCPFEF